MLFSGKRFFDIRCIHNMSNLSHQFMLIIIDKANSNKKLDVSVNFHSKKYCILL